jgi:sugar lactone lactonase YvrE
MAIRAKHLTRVLSAAGACWAIAAVSAAAAGPALVAGGGDARTILALAPGNHPEGIAAGKRGVLYLGNRRDDGAGFVSEILAIARDGSVSTLAVLARLDRDNPGDDGVLGLATDRRGDVYAAVVAPGAAAHGVWQIARDGSRRTRLPGSERITFPNALAFDRRGNLYVTDSFGGAIWRFASRRGRATYRAGEPWVRHELLAPALDDPFGFPLPGANGIAFAPPNRLYVANTEKGLIARVPIDLADGSAGEPAVVAAGPDLATVDGLAADAHGRVHAAIPGHAILGTAPLVRVDPVTGVVSGIDPGEWDEFDVPLSLTIDTRRQARACWRPTATFPASRPRRAGRASSAWT